MNQELRHQKKIALNTLFLSITEIVQITMPFVALPFIIRVVGAINYGKVVFAQSICTYFTVFASFGLEFLGAKEISINRDDKKKCGEILGTILFLKFILCTIGFIIFCAIILLWDRTNTDPLVYLFAYGACIADILFVQWLFQGLEKMFIITAIKSFSLVIYVVLLLTILRTENQYRLIPLLQSSSLIATSLIGLFFTCFYVKIQPKVSSIEKLFSFARESFAFFLSRISLVINSSIASTVIGVTLGDYAVAVYDLALKITKAVLVPVSMINQAIYPHNVKYHDFAFSFKIFVFTMTLTIFGATTLYFIAPYLVDILGHGKLPDSSHLIRILLFYAIMGSISIYLGTPTLVAWGYSKPFNQSVIFATISLIVSYAFFLYYKINNIYYYCFALYLGVTIELSYRLLYFFKFRIYSCPKATT